MTARRPRTIAVVSIVDPATFAEDLAGALRGRAAALVFIQRALDYLRNVE